MLKLIQYFQNLIIKLFTFIRPQNIIFCAESPILLSMEQIVNDSSYVNQYYNERDTDQNSSYSLVHNNSIVQNSFLNMVDENTPRCLDKNTFEHRVNTESKQKVTKRDGIENFQIDKSVMCEFHPFNPENLDVSKKTQKSSNSIPNLQDVINWFQNTGNIPGHYDIGDHGVIDIISTENPIDEEFLTVLTDDTTPFIPERYFDSEQIGYIQSNNDYTDEHNTILHTHVETMSNDICTFGVYLNELRSVYSSAENKTDNEQSNNVLITESETLKSHFIKLQTKNEKEHESVEQLFQDNIYVDPKVEVPSRKRSYCTMAHYDCFNNNTSCIKKMTPDESLNIDYASVNVDTKFTKPNYTTKQFKFYLNGKMILEKNNFVYDPQMLLKFIDDQNFIKVEYNSLESKNLCNNTSLFPLFYSYYVPIFNTIKFNINKPFKYFLITSRSEESSINQIISGTVYFMNTSIKPTDGFSILLENTDNYDYNVLFSELLKTEFPIYNFSKYKRQKRILLRNSNLTETHKKRSLEEYLLNFSKFSEQFLQYQSSKYSELNQIPIVNSTNAVHLPNNSWRGSILLITKFTINLIENFEKIKKILPNTLSIRCNSIRGDIGVLLGNVLLEKKPEWCIMYTNDRNVLSFEEDTVISFYIFFHREIWPVLEYWKKYIFTYESPKYIEAQNLLGILQV